VDCLDIAWICKSVEGTTWEVSCASCDGTVLIFRPNPVVRMVGRGVREMQGSLAVLSSLSLLCLHLSCKGVFWCICEQGVGTSQTSASDSALTLLAQTAITAANRAGQLFVTAAGNDYGTDIDATPTFPAAYQMPNILSVISTNESMQLAPFSNYGAKLVDLAAPGTHILSTTLKGGYGEHDGTSQSAGYVAGAAALLLAAYRQAGFKNATGAQVLTNSWIKR
jgi:hypothetical protein